MERSGHIEPYLDETVAGWNLFLFEPQTGAEETLFYVERTRAEDALARYIAGEYIMDGITV